MGRNVKMCFVMQKGVRPKEGKAFLAAMLIFLLCFCFGEVLVEFQNVNMLT